MGGSASIARSLRDRVTAQGGKIQKPFTKQECVLEYMMMNKRKEGEKHESNADNSKPAVHPVGNPADSSSTGGAKDREARSSDESTKLAETDMQPSTTDNGMKDNLSGGDSASGNAPTPTKGAFRSSPSQSSAAEVDEIVRRAEHRFYQLPQTGVAGKTWFDQCCRRACDEAIADLRRQLDEADEALKGQL
jgi:hypothetical protein